MPSTNTSSAIQIGFRFLLLLLFLSLLAGCSRELKRIYLESRIEAVEDLNPNKEGESSPVVMRIYQLKTIGAFQSADFFALMDDEARAIGEDLIAREELELRPGQSIEMRRNFGPAVRYIGVVVAFRDLEKARWRAFSQLPRKTWVRSHKRVGITIRLERLAVDIDVTR